MDCVVNVMMFGGRRCGKTSIIAAMRSCFQDVFNENTNLDITISDPETMNVINEKSNEIAQYFYDKTGVGTGIILDKSYAATTELMEYKLDIFLKDKNGSKVTLNLCDYPGEWLDKNHQDQQEILQLKMKYCNIIMIAIDTVYLMEKTLNHQSESVGQYNEGRNYCLHIADMIKNLFGTEDEDSSIMPKMIMFVPLKCEKYYNRRQIELVNRKIYTAYKEIFDFIEEIDSDNYEVIIAPILTFGENTVEFARFERDTDGEIKFDRDLMIPSTPRYVFKDMYCTYSPKYCEQPLLYTLAYLLDQMQKLKDAEKRNAGLFKRLKLKFLETFGDLATAEDFLREKDNIKKWLKIDGEGYEIVYDPLHFADEEMTL